MEIASSLWAILVSVVSAVGPATIYALLVWWADRYEKEPLGLLAVTFVWGAIPAILISLVAEAVFGMPLAGMQAERLANVLQASGMAPVVEEIAKGVAVLGVFILARREFDDLLDGVVYGALVGIGFGMTENLLYFLSSFFEGGWADLGVVIFLRSVVFGLNHAFFSAFAGAGFGLARVTRRRWLRWLAPLLGLGAAIGFHGLHNLGVTLAEESTAAILLSLFTDSGGLLIVLVIILVAWRQERRWIQEELRGEVGALLSATEYGMATTYGRRMQLWWRTLSKEGWAAARRQGKAHRLLTELAFRKHRLRVFGTEHNVALVAEIGRLREEILAMRVGDEAAPPAA